MKLIMFMPLIDFDSKVNIIISTYVLKLGFIIWKTNVETQKINKSLLKIYNIIIISFKF